MSKFVLASLFLSTQVLALKLHSSARTRDAEGENFAYATLLKFPAEVNRKKADREAGRTEQAGLKDMGKMEQNMETENLAEALIPPHGYKEYGPQTVFRMDDALRKYGSKYPLVVITDDPRLIKSPQLKDHPNLKIIRIPEDMEDVNEFYPHVGAMLKHVRPTAQKLSFFNMTQYDKIVAFDLDVLVQGNVDHLFQDYDTEGGATVIGAYNDEAQCGKKPNVGNPQNGGPKNLYFQSSVMVLTPQPDIMEKIRRIPFVHKWGDQAIIQEFFRTEEGKKPAKLFEAGLITYPHCKDATTAPLVHQR